MNSRVFSIPFGVFALIMCVCYPIFAQVGGGRAAGGSQSIASPPPQSTAPAPDVAPPASQIQIPFKKNEQQSTGQKQGLQGQQQNNNDKQNSDTTEDAARPPVAGQRTGLSRSSAIEASFQDLIQTRTPANSAAQLQGISQFGYGIFGLSSSFGKQMDDVPVGTEYVLGPGDELHVITWGAIENTLNLEVDRYGKIYLPVIGPIHVWGLTFPQAEKLILAYLSQYYKGFQANVTMGRIRTIKIYVMGEVNQPGSYNISALSSLINALAAAGGPSNMGTLRNIQLKRNNQIIVEFDFYDFLLYGDKSKDCRLESGDIIFVPSIGGVVGITGEVKRPAIYEFKETLRIKDLIALANGLTVQSYLNRVQIIRKKPGAERVAIDIDLVKAMGREDVSDNIELQDGDLVTIYPSEQSVYNTVTLSGTVKQPGDYELKPDMRISQLLTPQAMETTSYLANVEIVRFKEDFSTQVLHVDLKKVWSGDLSNDVILMPRDKIYVRTDVKGAGSVVLTGEFKLPGDYVIQPGERISDVVKRAGGFTANAYLKGAVFTRVSVAERERERLDALMMELEEKMAAETKIIWPNGANSDAEDAKRRAQLKAIASKVILGRIAVNLEGLAGSEDDLVLQEGDSLTARTPPAEVFVLGSVRSPGAIVHKKGKPAKHYIELCGGLSKYAEKKEMYLLRIDGTAFDKVLKIKDVEPGDTIIIPSHTKTIDFSWIGQIATVTSQTMLTIAALMVIANQ